MRRTLTTLALTALVIATALTTCALTATSVQARPLCEKESGGTHFALCFGEPLELETGAYRLHINNDPTKPTKEFELVGSGVEMKCPETLLQLGATITATTAGGKSLGIKATGIIVHFINCTLPKPAHCVVKENSVISDTLDAVPPRSAEDRKFLVYPETGIIFSTLTFESSGGTCAIAGKVNVMSLNDKEEEGPLCNAPDAESTSILHLQECTGASGSSNLKVKEEEVSFKGNFSTLLEGQKTKWAIILGK